MAPNNPLLKRTVPQTVSNDPTGLRLYTLDNGLKVYLSQNSDEPKIQTYIDGTAAAGYTSLVQSSIWNVIRIERNEKLKDSDWTVMEGSPLSVSKKDEWKTYRQALRDMPSGTTPEIDVNQNIISGLTWPSEPS